MKKWSNFQLVFSKSSPLIGVKGGGDSPPFEVQQLDMYGYINFISLLVNNDEIL